MKSNEYEEKLRLLGSKYNELKRRYLYQIISVDTIVEFRAQLFELCAYYFNVDLSDMYQHIDIKCSPENSSAIHIVNLTKIGELMISTLSIAEDVFIKDSITKRQSIIKDCSSCRYKPLYNKELPCCKCMFNRHPEVRNNPNLEDMWQQKL